MLPRLAAARPDFCSVTCGAGGDGVRARTLQIVDRMQREQHLTAMAHVTCVSFTRAGMDAFLDEAAGLGIRNILALRGDPPADRPDFRRPPGGFDYAYQLIDVLKARASEFAIGCAGFPEGHPECGEGRHVDWQRLRDKVEHGAEFILTQLFFDNADYFEMVEHLTGRLGVTVPITPGVLPILNARQVRRFTALCGATLPAPLVAELDRLGDDDEAVTGVRRRLRHAAVRGAAGGRRARPAPLRPQPLAVGARDTPQPGTGVGRRGKEKGPDAPLAAACPALSFTTQRRVVDGARTYCC